MRSYARPAAYLSGLSLLLGYVVLQQDKLTPWDWSMCLIGLSLVALIHCFAPAGDMNPWLHRRLERVWWLLPLYVLFQLAPLPLTLVERLSPARAEAARALASVGAAIQSAPLTVDAPATFDHLLRIVGYLLLFLLVRISTAGFSFKPWLMTLPLLLLGVYEAMDGLLQYGADPARAVAHGTWPNRDHYADFLAMVLPFALAAGIFIVRRAMAVSRGITSRAAIWACVALCVTGIFLLAVFWSLSRMGLVAALSSFFAVCAMSLGRELPPLRRTAMMAGVAAALLIGAVTLEPERLMQRFMDISDNGALKGDVRTVIWRETTHLIAAYPIFGCGMGAYGQAFPRYKTISPVIPDKFAHNDYLQVTSELGAVGTAIVALLVLLALRTAVRVARKHPDFTSRELGVACLAALIAIVVHSLADFNLYIPANAMTVAWITGISAGLNDAPQETVVWVQPGIPDYIDVQV